MNPSDQLGHGCSGFLAEGSRKYFVFPLGRARRVEILHRESVQAFRSSENFRHRFRDDLSGEFEPIILGFVSFNRRAPVLLHAKSLQRELHANLAEPKIDDCDFGRYATLEQPDRSDLTGFANPQIGEKLTASFVESRLVPIACAIIGQSAETVHMHDAHGQRSSKASELRNIGAFAQDRNSVGKMDGLAG